MAVDKSQFKPATTWRLERAKQRILQQQQLQQEKAVNGTDPLDNKPDAHSPFPSVSSDNVDAVPSVHELNQEKPQWNPQYQDPAELSEAILNHNLTFGGDRRTSAHSFTRIVPNSTASSSVSSVMDDIKPQLNSQRHDSAYTVYSDASDRFSFDNQAITGANNTLTRHSAPVANSTLHHHSPASSTSSQNMKVTELRVEPLLPRSSPTTATFPH